MVAKQAALLIVSSLSPLCQAPETKSSALECLERFVAGASDLYGTKAGSAYGARFFGKTLYYLAYFFCKRYNRERNVERSGQQQTPATRRIDGSLKRAFVLLLRQPILQGCFSTIKDLRSRCLRALSPLAEPEPGLVVPTALERLFTTSGSMVDATKVYISMQMLCRLAPVMARERGLRCHLPFAISHALSGINPNNSTLTASVGCFVELAAYAIPWKALAKHIQDSKDEPSQDKITRDWWKAEVESWQNAKPFTAEVDYGQELSEKQEEKLFLSASSMWGEIVKRFLSGVQSYYAAAFASIHDHNFSPDSARLREPELSLAAAAEACIQCLPPTLLKEVMEQLADFASSQPVPHAWNGLSRIVGSVVRADPKSGVDIFAPVLIDAIRREIEDKWVGTKHYESCLSVNHDLAHYLALLKQCLLNGGPETLRIKGDILVLFGHMKEKCERHYTGRVELIAGILRALTDTYPTSCHGTVRPGYWDWEDVKVEWHQPSRQELSAGCGLFVSEMDEAIETLETVMRELKELGKQVAKDEQKAKDETEKKGTLERLGRRKKLIRLLGDALSYVNRMLADVAALFDPVKQENDPSSASGRKQAHHDGDVHHREQALIMSKDFCRVLHPQDRGYDKIHDCRRRSAAVVHMVLMFLRDHHEANSECQILVYNIYQRLVSDVGYRTTSQETENYIQRQGKIADLFSLPMAEARLLPGLHFVGALRRHHCLQLHAILYRLADEVEEQVVRDLVKGCSSPYSAVCQVARGVLGDVIAGLSPSFCGYFLELMMSEHEKMLNQNKGFSEKGAISSLGTFLQAAGALKRYCPSQMPRLVDLLMKTLGIDHKRIQRLSAQCLQAMNATNFGEKPLPDAVLGNAIGQIRPAGSSLDAIEKKREAAGELQAKERDDMRAKAKEILDITTTKSSCYYFAITYLVDFKNGAPAKFLDCLAQGVLDANRSVRQTSLYGLSSLIKATLARADRGGPEDYVLRQGESEWGMTKVVPGTDGKAWTDTYLARIALRPESVDYFADRRIGSLVWSEFTARTADAKPVGGHGDSEAAKTLKEIGAIFSKPWIARLLGRLAQTEPSRDGMSDESGPGLLHIPVYTLQFLREVFYLMSRGMTAATLDDLEPLVQDVFGDGKTVGQHYAIAVLLLGLVFTETSLDFRIRGMDVAERVIIKMLREHLDEETSVVWRWTIEAISMQLDPCQYPQLTRNMTQLRLSDSSESILALESRIRIVNTFVRGLGWRFPDPKSVSDEILANVAVGAAASSDADRQMGSLLADLFNTRFCPSFASSEAYWNAHPPSESAPLGLWPYQQPSPDMYAMARSLLGRVVVERLESAPHDGEIASNGFVRTARVTLYWLASTLASAAAPVLVAFCLGDDSPLFAALLGVLDMKRHVDADELRESARIVLGTVVDLPLHMKEQYEAVRAAICRAAQPGVTMRSREVSINMMHRLYLRSLFTSLPDEQRAALRIMLGWVGDAEPEVRKKAAAALQHMLRVTPPNVTDEFVADMVRKSGQEMGEWASIKPRPEDKERARLKRLRLSGAVLAVAAAVSAFTMMTECREWMLEALSALGNVAWGAVNAEEARKAIRTFKAQSKSRWKTVWNRLSPESQLSLMDWASDPNSEDFS